MISSKIKTNRVYKFGLFDTDEVKKLIKTKRLFVVLPDSSFSSHTVFNKVVGVVKKIYEKDDDVFVEWKLLKTPAGNIIKEIIRFIELSPLGVGTTTQIDDKKTIVNDDYILNAFGVYPKEVEK